MKIQLSLQQGLTQLQATVVEALTAMIAEYCTCVVDSSAYLVPQGFRSFFLQGAMHPRVHFTVKRYEDQNDPIVFFVDFRDDGVYAYAVVYRRVGERCVVDWRRTFVLDNGDSVSLFNVFESVITEVRNGRKETAQAI